MKSKISLKQLQALESVVRLGSFTLAAKELGVSQPTVSNLVNSLEQHYQCRLLDRSGSVISSTPLLNSIRGDIKALIALRNDIDDRLTAARNLHSGTFQIGYSTYQIAMPFISEFVRAFPAVDVTARALASHDLLPLLYTGEFDVGLITAKELPSDLSGKEISETRIGLVVPKDHALADNGPVSWAEVASLKLIQREPSSSTRQIFDAAAQVARVKLTTILGLGSWGSIRTLVTTGVGVGVAFAQECQNEPGVAFVPVADKNLTARHFLACLPAMRHTSAVSNFFRIAEGKRHL
ncbi:MULTISPECIES: LysR substrate-binding domain-containing protein [unclassified Ruegeria]|uniref:LysR substrate-binding domain-containing protein n=1 Tax=unclassified Ruegeria TaxID=2625375 RepID=UPI001ADA85B0|nr:MULTISPECIES: LysR substrate-binding domain-containing protein [unclassified Ruegeria]MBO9410946.1 LysR family transcriptional regulator [Ruegeria sp. R8_1]MBO9415147.1 LysR family transcriptional regulator [Ruegeria sp. R8_2]